MQIDDVWREMTVDIVPHWPEEEQRAQIGWQISAAASARPSTVPALSVQGTIAKRDAYHDVLRSGGSRLRAVSLSLLVVKRRERRKGS